MAVNLVNFQVELMRTQLRRAQRRADTQDMELAMDMMVAFSQKKEGRNADSAILERLASKLELHNVADLQEETVAVRKLAKRGSLRQNAESIQQIADLLGKFKEIAGIYEDFLLDGPVSTRSPGKCQSLLIPHEFLCPITLEIMTDPVIVATGQVISSRPYELFVPLVVTIYAHFDIWFHGLHVVMGKIISYGFSISLNSGHHLNRKLNQEKRNCLQSK